MFTHSQEYPDSIRPSFREVGELERRENPEEEGRGWKRRGKEGRDREMEERKQGTRKDRAKEVVTRGALRAR